MTQPADHRPLYPGCDQHDRPDAEPTRPIAARGHAARLSRGDAPRAGGGRYRPPPWSGRTGRPTPPISAASSAASWRRSRHAGRPHLVDMPSAVPTAAWSATLSTPAVTGTAPSARAWHAPNGWRPARPSCCRCPTSMSSSPCRRPPPRSPSTTRRWSTPFCFVLRPRRCAASAPIRVISAPRSARSRCCTVRWRNGPAAGVGSRGGRPSD